jgi:hypothetical protein
MKAISQNVQMRGRSLSHHTLADIRETAKKDYAEVLGLAGGKTESRRVTNRLKINHLRKQTTN